MLNVCLDTTLANSFRNFHAKGFDYICIKRTDNHTIKLYNFDGDLSKMPEVVNPHDHRYDFKTRVLSGQVSNICFTQSNGLKGKPFNRFDYMTPLNGGTGFEWREECWLIEQSNDLYVKGQEYFMPHDELHTISIRQNNTWLVLDQFESSLSKESPTSTYIVGSKEPPSLSGLYDSWKADDLIKVIQRLNDERIFRINLIR